MVALTANSSSQKILEKLVIKAQFLMGIGSGGDVQTSGEASVFELLKKRGKPPYCIFDVGANKGQFLHLVSGHISDVDCSIHCFEPSTTAFKELNDSATGKRHIKLNNLALGEEPNHSVLYCDNEGSGLASLTKRRLEHFNIDFSKEERVPVDTIDSYCRANEIDFIDLLKIDIEGHELAALAGASDMLKNHSIGIITFEFGGCNIDTKTFFQDFWYFFQALGFVIYRITPSGYLHPLKAYKEIYEQFRTINFVAVSSA